MKLNNRGFAISSIMYIILVMCIILITVTLSIFSSRNLILDKQKKETLSNIYNEEGYNRPSIPELIDGLTPIKYNGSNWVVADTSKEWYNYSKQEWANAAILNSGVTKNVGDTVNVASEVKAMFVWIPRYEYKIDGTYGKGGTSATTPGEIEVRFVSKNRTGLKDEYRVHPAFTFGDEELSGMWVGKFETSHAALSSNTANNLNCSNENCANADGLRILPSVAPLTNNTVSNFFFAARSMTRNGNGFALNSNDANSHMMKNSEWGAVVYLSQSKYGKYGNPNYSGAEKQVRINNCYNSNYTTGIGASSQNETQSTTTCATNTYETVNGQTASTTGNITGIYDMSGGAYEYVMGVLLDSSGNPRSGADNSYNSGFTGTLSSGTTYNGISFPNFKYYNTYTSTDSSSTNATISKTACSGGVCYGHAFSETSEWYGDSFGFVSANNPWVYRGGGSGDSSWAGVFASNIDRGRNSVAISFRIVISPNS